MHLNLFQLYQRFVDSYNLKNRYISLVGNVSLNYSKKKKALYGPFLWMGFNFLKATEPLRGDSLLSTPKSPGETWYSFDRPQKDGRLSRSWSHPVVFNLGPLDWKSSAQTTVIWDHALITQNFRKILRTF